MRTADYGAKIVEVRCGLALPQFALKGRRIDQGSLIVRIAALAPLARIGEPLRSVHLRLCPPGPNKVF